MINYFIEYLNEKGQELDFSFGIKSISDTGRNINNNKFSGSLTVKEAQIFNSLKINKRKIDWLAGRLAAKEALMSHFNIEYIPYFSILNNIDRSPYIEGNTHLTLSISHSSDLAIALISKNNIGIDVEKIVDHNRLLLKYYFTNTETHQIKKRNYKVDVDESITKYWTRKEAVSKYLKLGMNINFNTLDTVPDQIRIDNQKYVKIVSEKISNHYLSIAI